MDKLQFLVLILVVTGMLARQRARTCLAAIPSRTVCKGECLEVHSHDTQYSPQQTSSATSLFLAPITNVIDSITYLRAAAVFWTLCNNASLLISIFDNDCDVAYMLDLLAIFDSVDKTT